MKRENALVIEQVDNKTENRLLQRVIIFVRAGYFYVFGVYGICLLIVFKII